MKLLFDQNLSHKLIGALEKEFPGSNHVREVGLASADDLAVWEYAKKLGFTIVSEMLLASPSKGAYLNSQIKPNYRFKRVL